MLKRFMIAAALCAASPAAHLDGNVFEQVRRKMADDPDNRWDHTRAIGGPK